MLTIGVGDKSGVEGPQPVRTIPPHFSRVTEASEEDMARVFGSEDERHFYVGNPLDMETKVCLDLGEYAKRSNGVFGKSGTGKTFLTRLLLAGSIQKGTAVNLVFDMHSEYGWEGRSEERYKVKGLETALSVQGGGFHPGPGQLPTQEGEHRLRREDRVRRDRAGGH